MAAPTGQPLSTPYLRWGRRPRPESTLGGVLYTCRPAAARPLSVEDVGLMSGLMGHLCGAQLPGGGAVQVSGPNDKAKPMPANPTAQHSPPAVAVARLRLKGWRFVLASISIYTILLAFIMLIKREPFVM